MRPCRLLPEFRTNFAIVCGHSRSEWVETGCLELTFPELQPNEYRLEVQARAGDGQWSEKKTAFAFVIRPPWWRTWWYRGLLALAAVGALVSLWRWRVYRLVVRQRELEAAVAERTRQLREQAIKDGLTGLFNRNAFFEVLERELSKMRRKGGDLALIMGDLDHFKSINDTHGHQAGDAVLKDSAHRILQCVRVYDTVGRYGGEELAVLMPGCCLEEAQPSRGTPKVYCEHAIRYHGGPRRRHLQLRSDCRLRRL